jgi:predicted RNA-binding Zn-ribbon protein involved in translation (DUF1610 family)
MIKEDKNLTQEICDKAAADFLYGLLPTSEEYAASAFDIAFPSTRQWSEPKYRCPRCGGGMCRNEMIVLTSYPAQYTYQCDKCGHVEYQYM